jgi:O-antigen ligase
VLFLAAMLEWTAGISGLIIESLGRDPDLTTRVPLWKTLLVLETNPLIGVGYESFWSGERLVHVWRHFPGVMQAHNGYLDLYLNVGLVGLLLLLVSIISGFVSTVRQLDHDYAISLLRIAFIVVVVMYNWTEATLKPVSNIVIILLWGILNVSGGTTALQEDNESLNDREEVLG